MSDEGNASGAFGLLLFPDVKFLLLRILIINLRSTSIKVSQAGKFTVDIS